MEALEKEVRCLGKNKQVKFTKRNYITATDAKGDKYKIKTWEQAKEFIHSYDPDAPEIFSPCCSFGSDGSENVMVKMSECPTKRELGKRTIEPHHGKDAGKSFEVVTCIYRSIFSGGFPTCPHYQGTKVVKRPDEECGYIREQYKILCSAIQ